MLDPKQAEERFKQVYKNTPYTKMYETRKAYIFVLGTSPYDDADLAQVDKETGVCRDYRPWEDPDYLEEYVPE